MLREWQTGALSYLQRNNDDFLCVATPGSGKTTFALEAARRAIERHEASRIIVVVPTSHLRKQWASAAAAAGIQLDYRFANGSGAIARDYDGAVVTYSTVASQPLLWRKLATGALVILDEIHHAGERAHLSWGPSLRQAFDLAARRLLLSGTPFRSDGAPIPYVRYSASGQCESDYNYDYGTALLDAVVRPVEFLALDGSVRWRQAGQVIASSLVEADDDDLGNALGAAYDSSGEWISSVLRRADSELTQHRGIVPDAAGLVVAAGQAHARQYAALLRQICRESPVVAISDDPDASELIAKFARQDTRWLVAVQMVSEGVDIPRLCVGVYASKVRTQLFFRQVVGRLVRMRGPEDETTATLLIPSIDPLLGYAQLIEKTVDATMREEEARVRQAVEKPETGQLVLDLVEPIDSSEATHHSTILSGDSFSDAEIARANALLERAALPPSVKPSHIAKVARLLGAGRIVGKAVVDAPEPAVPLADQKATMRRLVQHKVGRVANLSGRDHSEIHAKLNRICGDTAKTATAETLAQRLQILDQWAEAQP